MNNWLYVGWWIVFLMLSVWMRRDSRKWWAEQRKLEARLDKLDESIQRVVSGAINATPLRVERGIQR